jgi:hypothetical protein
MSGGQRQPGEMDVLELAEAVAAGQLTRTQAEATLRERHAGDAGALAADRAELDSLVAAIGGVRRHAAAFREASDRHSAETVTAGGVSVDPRPVGGSGVVLRPGRGQRNRWAAPALLAAAAVVVVAVVVGSNLATAPVAGSPSPASSGIAVASPSVSSNPSASGAPSPIATTSPSVAPTAVPEVTAGSTAAPGLPSIPNAPLPGAPIVTYWTLDTETSMMISTWAPDGSAPAFTFSVTTWADPDRSGGNAIDRRVVVSPGGQRVVVAETEFSPSARARLRVFGTDGSVLWTDPSPTGTPDLVWSPDGLTLVIGSQPATWKIVTFGSRGAAATVKTRTFPGQAYRVLGFSKSGAILYGWDTQGEAEWWETPFQVPVTGGSVTPITRFSGKAEPIAIANGTTPTSEVTPADSSSLLQPGVDPKTYRVLDLGGASGSGGWEIRDGAVVTPLLLTGSPSLAWAADGDIARLNNYTSNAGNGLVLGTVAASHPVVSTGPAFTTAGGDYRYQLVGVRGATALLGLTSHTSDGVTAGVDELVAVDLTTASSAVLVTASAGLTGLHVAGWINGG